MSNRVLLAQLAEMPFEEALRLPVEQLAMLLEEGTAEKLRVSGLVGIVHAALERQFAERAAEVRRQAGKDTGKARVPEGDHVVVCDLPKKVTWDQDKLWAAVEQLEGMGEDPGEYVDRRLSVRESAYAAWPSGLRAMFEPARTVSTGTPTYSIERVSHAAR